MAPRRPIPLGRTRLVLLPLAFCLTALFGCGPAPNPRYHLGNAYQASGAWHYPRESFELDETGLGVTLPASRPALTANGEAYDASAMAAAHPTLQLPAIARLTNLENGLSVLVRINDRGTGNPRRLVEFTPRVATLLRVPPNTPVQVRLTLLPDESRQALDGLPGTPSLAIAAAPRGAIQADELAPPPGAASRPGIALTTAVAESRTATPTARPMRLAETLTQGAPSPGRLVVRLGTFEEYQYAMIQRARVAALGPAIETTGDRRHRRYKVRIGPFATVAEADAAQARAMDLGVPDARIVVE